MTSPAEEAEEVREKTIREQVGAYRQLRERLLREVERYLGGGNERLARVISESLKE
jgi:hypothetical protein